MSRQTIKRLIWVAVFGVSMGFFEAAIVVYLRRIAYPEGFSFPLKMLDTQLAVVELVREFASLIMIASVAVIAGKRLVDKLAYFFYIFGIWDIFYYVFLKLALDWPSSLLEPDILFLIPVPWVGPVLAPVLVSVVMISAGIVTVRLEDIGAPIRVTRWNLPAEMICGLVVVVSFCLDWRSMVSGGLPGPFAWWLFLPGLIPATGIFIYEAARAWRNTLKTNGERAL